jgi:hypothetical protein
MYHFRLYALRFQLFQDLADEQGGVPLLPRSPVKSYDLHIFLLGYTYSYDLKLSSLEQRLTGLLGSANTAVTDFVFWSS